MFLSSFKQKFKALLSTQKEILIHIKICSLERKDSQCLLMGIQLKHHSYYTVQNFIFIPDYFFFQ